MTRRRGIVVYFVLALALFAASSALPWLLGAAIGDDGFAHSTWKTQFVVKTAMVIMALVGIAVRGNGFRAAGFRRAAGKGWVWRAVVFGGLLGGLGTALIVATPAEGMNGLGQLGFGGLVLWIWFYSSVAEEIFVRGWLQTALGFAAERKVRILGKSFTAPVLASGVFFGAIHLSLLVRGADGWTVAIIVAGTTLLGLLAAELRERFGSLLPAVVAHVAFNVGGAVAGILVAIATRLVTGHLPATG